MRVCSIPCLLNAHATLDWRGLVALPRILDRGAAAAHCAAPVATVSIEEPFLPQTFRIIRVAIS